MAVVLRPLAGCGLPGALNPLGCENDSAAVVKTAFGEPRALQFLSQAAKTWQARVGDERNIDRRLGERLGSDPLLLLSLAIDLHDGVPSIRSDAAGSLRMAATHTPAAVLPYAGDLAAALGQPERRTRWEALSALRELASHDAGSLVWLADDVADTLYDGDSPAMRRRALDVLSAMSVCSPAAATLLWPLLDEALVFFRGEAEYPPLLASAVLAIELGAKCDAGALLDLAALDVLDRRARVRVLAWRLRALLRAA